MTIENTAQDPVLLYGDVLENPIVRAVGGWYCRNHDDAIDEDAYVAKASADIGAFSDKLDSALSLL